MKVLEFVAALVVQAVQVVLVVLPIEDSVCSWLQSQSGSNVNREAVQTRTYFQAVGVLSLHETARRNKSLSRQDQVV